jgi:RNA polymerase sigma-70 factor (ECF subfamily)
LEEKRNIKVVDYGTAIDEPSVVRAAQDGNKAAFARLVKLYQKRVLRMVIGMVGDLDNAMDIVQESFIRAWQALDRFDVSQPFYPWLSRIATNLSINHIKKASRQTSLNNEVIERADNAPDPLAKLQLEENNHRLMQAIGELPEQYRIVFVLRTFEELSYEEIAEQLDIAPGTVDSRLYRARRLLVEKLGELLEE